MGVGLVAIGTRMKFVITGIEKVRDVVEAEDQESAQMFFRVRYPAVRVTEVNIAGSRVKLPIKRKKRQIQEGISFMYPKYVAFRPENEDYGCALRRVGKKRYWRDAGAWGCNTKVVDGKLRVSAQGHLRHLNGNPLFEVSEEVWRKSNGQYAPVIKERNYEIQN